MGPTLLKEMALFFLPNIVEELSNRDEWGNYCYRGCFYLLLSNYMQLNHNREQTSNGKMTLLSFKEKKFDRNVWEYKILFRSYSRQNNTDNNYNLDASKHNYVKQKCRSHGNQEPVLFKVSPYSIPQSVSSNRLEFRFYVQNSRYLKAVFLINSQMPYNQEKCLKNVCTLDRCSIHNAWCCGIHIFFETHLQSLQIR